MHNKKKFSEMKHFGLPMSWLKFWYIFVISQRYEYLNSDKRLKIVQNVKKMAYQVKNYNNNII